MHVPGQRGRAAIAPHLGRGQAIGAEIGAAAALGFGDADAEQPVAMHVAVVVGREACLAVPAGGAGGEDRLAEFARLGAQRRLLRRQAEGRRVEDRGVGGEQWGRASMLSPPAGFAGSRAPRR